MKAQDLKFEDCWESFKDAAIPPSAPAVQVDCMYQAFLAGAVTVCQYFEALTRDAPTNLTSGIRAWRQTIESEVERIAKQTKQ